MRLVAIVSVLLLVGVTLSVGAEAPWAVKSNASGYSPGAFVRTYSELSPSDALTVIGTKNWRVINSTGNCCENHISVGPGGRIVDIGGAYPIFSTNGGLTWQRFVATAGVLLGAEGSGTFAPNGDWVGVTWDPYTGDRVIAVKYVAAENAWYSSMVALHSPVYDRPFVGVIPGPLTFQGQTYPYATLMRGGTAVKFSYISFDGLTYALASPGDLAFNNKTTSWLNEPSVAWADWVQPIASARTLPLPGGGALFAPDRFCSWALWDTDSSMRCHTFPNGAGVTFNSAPRFDSQGRLHLFESALGKIVHRMSSDGGQTWKYTNLTLPPNTAYQGGMIDTAVNGSLDMAVVGVRADVFLPFQTTKILIYKISNLSTASPDVKLYQVGKGDRLFYQGVNAPGSRMDFMTLGLLPDGRVVTTFGDWVHSTPRMAIEQP